MRESPGSEGSPNHKNHPLRVIPSKEKIHSPPNLNAEKEKKHKKLAQGRREIGETASE